MLVPAVPMVFHSRLPPLWGFHTFVSTVIRFRNKCLCSQLYWWLTLLTHWGDPWGSYWMFSLGNWRGWNQRKLDYHSYFQWGWTCLFCCPGDDIVDGGRTYPLWELMIPRWCLHCQTQIKLELKGGKGVKAQACLSEASAVSGLSKSPRFLLVLHTTYGLLTYHECTNSSKELTLSILSC